MDEDLARLVPLAGVAAADAVRQHRGQQPPQRPVDVADQLDLRPVGGVDLGRRGVDVDDPLRPLRVPPRRRVLDRVVADRHDEVRAVEARQDVVARLEPDRHQREVRPVVDRALAHERHRDRHVQAAGEGAQLGRRVAAQDAVAGEHDRALRGGEQPRGVGDGLVGGLREVGLARLERSDLVAALGRRGGQVLGQLDVGRAGLLEGRDPERLADDLGDRLDPLDARVPLRDRREHVDDVDDLVGLLVELVRGRLAGDRDHRGAVEVRVGDAGDEVRRARAERAHRDGGPAGQPAVDVGHERGALLVAGRDVADRLAPRQRVEDVHRLLAGHREDPAAVLGGEAVDEEVGGGTGRAGRRGHAPSVAGS